MQYIRKLQLTDNTQTVTVNVQKALQGNSKTKGDGEDDKP